jgi:hypothetical protein
MNRRFYLHLRDDRTFVLKDASGTWKKRFFTLLQSLHFLISLDPDTSTRLTVVDSLGRPVDDTFV